MHLPPAVVGLVAILSIGACVAHVEGALEIDGVPFSGTWCGSGETRGFHGVELVDTLGRRLRLGENLDGTAAVAYFEGGSGVGETLPVCAAVEIRPGVGKVGGTRNLDGSATFSCFTDRHRITGVVRFENCH